MSLSEAKHLVFAHPAWVLDQAFVATLDEAAEELHGETGATAKPAEDAEASRDSP